MKNIAVLTSGGDCPGMNACVRAITRRAIEKGFNVFGVLRGYQGLIDGEFIPLNRRSVGNILHIGGTFLKTSRCDEFKTNAGFNKALENLKRAQIDGLIVIGGNGSFKGAKDLIDAGVKVVCVPATIDNDLYYTDFSLGFDTAVNTVTNLVNNIRDTSLAHDRISVIEVMGAYSGDIALNVGASVGADFVCVPEVEFKEKDLYVKLINNYKNGKTCSIIILNEKVMGAEKLSALINKNTKLSSRPLVIGHIQRGGSPSAKDRVLALKYGTASVDLLSSGKTGAVGELQGKIIAVSIDKAFARKREFDIALYNLVMDVSC